MAIDDVRKTFPGVAERIIGTRRRPSRIAVPAFSGGTEIEKVEMNH